MSGFIINNVIEDGDSTPRGRQSLTPVPTRQVYVPPQRRAFAHSTPERPESAMSDASFITQAPMNGGVSLRGYTNNTRGFGQADLSGKFHHALDSDGIPNTHGIEGSMIGNRMGMYGNGNLENRGYDGGFNDRSGGSRGLGDGSRGQASPGFQQHPNQPLIDDSAIASGLSTGSARDSAVGTSVVPTARQLADLIRMGLCDPSDDDEHTIIGSGTRMHTRNAHTAAAMSLTAPPRRQKYNVSDAQLDPVYKPAFATIREPDAKGNPSAFVQVIQLKLPEWFDFAANGIKPSTEEMFDDLPVVEACRVAVPSDAGVIRIRNIPYATPKAEITAIVNRNVQIISQPAGSPYFATHIVMERGSGKTMDAFIEVSTPYEAKRVVEQFGRRAMSGRPARVGDRVVEVETSSQEDFMSEMFPRAKNIVWHGATPKVLLNTEEFYPGQLSAGFTGFMTPEEIVMVVKHAEAPHRSVFASRIMVRVYESLTSTIHKYPWFAHECVNMVERRLLYDCCISVAKALMLFLRRTTSERLDNTKPTAATLKEMSVAVLTCPGFSEQQKFHYIQHLGAQGYAHFSSAQGLNVVFGGTSPFASAWPFMVLARNPASPERMVQYFASLISDAINGGRPLTLAQRFAMRTSDVGLQGPFGNLTIAYGDAKSLAQVGEIEMQTVEALLRRVLPISRSASQV
ncbi:hypothetical protein LTR78_006943 [Recurvomyces mirabilis]|uniref:RRM domain-containing protein n=1 Tax=Recurvomyces mirabilis TaxID=574656 RepID=A0AAE1BZ71_9PEZI|nr:hypothetical protein LTR78_006943 [Recurvomyces mirabilis]KAK5153327.1 hypothetical protein LTS14_007496 [Recurvomyces mirabilis]